MTVTAMPPKAGEAPNTEEEVKGSRKKKMVLALVLAMVLGATGWFFLKPSPPSEPVAGAVVSLEPIQVNLAGGHYLRLGLALQMAEGAEEAEGAKALDAAISIFSGREIADLARGQQREELRAELLEHLDAAYGGDVLGVYFTEFVTQ